MASDSKVETPIRIAFTYTADDYAEGWRAAAYHFRPKKLAFTWPSYLTLTVGCIVGGPLIIMVNRNDNGAVIVGSAVMGLGIWYLYGLLVHSWRTNFGVRREFAKADVLKGSQEMEFDEMVHRSRGPMYASELSWETYNWFAETANLYVLSQPTGNWLMIPKRAFALDQASEFEKLLKRKLTAAPPRPTSRGFLIALAIGVFILLVLYAALIFFSPKN